VSRVTEPVTTSSSLISGIFEARLAQMDGDSKILSRIFGLLHMNYAHYGDVQ